MAEDESQPGEPQAQPQASSEDNSGGQTETSPYCDEEVEAVDPVHDARVAALRLPTAEAYHAFAGTAFTTALHKATDKQFRNKRLDVAVSFASLASQLATHADNLAFSEMQWEDQRPPSVTKLVPLAN